MTVDFNGRTFIDRLKKEFCPEAVQGANRWLKESFTQGTGRDFLDRISASLKKGTLLSEADQAYLRDVVKLVYIKQCRGVTIDNISRELKNLV